MGNFLVSWSESPAIFVPIHYAVPMPRRRPLDHADAPCGTAGMIVLFLGISLFGGCHNASSLPLTESRSLSYYLRRVALDGAAGGCGNKGDCAGAEDAFRSRHMIRDDSAATYSGS